MNNLAGHYIGRYHILEQFGQGGMAVVYKAYDTRLERDVAFKLIRTDEIPPAQVERLMIRFEREAKAQASFNHPNIIPVFDYGQTDGFPYLVMAYISGGTLKQKTGQPVDLQTALGWLIPIADAIAYAHQNGVIHRDIKPSNILFDQSRPMLADFGIAKLLNTEEATLTGTGFGVGTPEYMAPEQWHGKPCEASDQYALAVVLYELITGQKPYTADTPAAVAIIQATEPLRPPSHWVQGIPDTVEKVLFKALAREPQNRYENMASFNNALKALSEQHAGQKSKRVQTAQLEPVHSESETIDIFASEPAKKSPTSLSPHTATPKVPQQNNLPQWLIWSGAGLLLICLVAGIVAAILGGRALLPSITGNGTEETATEENHRNVSIVENTDQQESAAGPMVAETEPEETGQDSQLQQSPQPTTVETIAIREQPTATPSPTEITEKYPDQHRWGNIGVHPIGFFFNGQHRNRFGLGTFTKLV